MSYDRSKKYPIIDAMTKKETLLDRDWETFY